jgi:hypothetical protein
MVTWQVEVFSVVVIQVILFVGPFVVGFYFGGSEHAVCAVSQFTNEFGVWTDTAVGVFSGAILSFFVSPAFFYLSRLGVEGYSFMWSHSHTTTVGRAPLDEGSAHCRDLYLTNTQHSQQTNIHAPGGIRTRDPSRRPAADPRLRPLGHWDWPQALLWNKISFKCLLMCQSGLVMGLGMGEGRWEMIVTWSWTCVPVLLTWQHALDEELWSSVGSNLQCFTDAPGWVQTLKAGCREEQEAWNSVT